MLHTGTVLRAKYSRWKQLTCRLQLLLPTLASTRLRAIWLKSGCFAYRHSFESKAQSLEAAHMQASAVVDRAKVNIEAKQRAEDDIRRDVELAKLGAENALVERVSCHCNSPVHMLAC